MTRYQVLREETFINLTNTSEQVYCAQGVLPIEIKENCMVLENQNCRFDLNGLNL